MNFLDVIEKEDFGQQSDQVFVKLPKVKCHHPGVDVHHIRQKDIVDILKNGYISGDLLTYFIAYFVGKIENGNVHVVDPLVASSFVHDRDVAEPLHVA